MTSTVELEKVAGLIDSAQQTGEPIEQFGESLDLQTAYDVQAKLLAAREARGEKLTGVKLGFTSAAKMAQMGVDEVIIGFITNQMAIENGGQMGLDRLVHPRVEPEVAFRVGRDVSAGATADELVAALDAVAPALEVIDSRYRDFRFSLTDVVADNTSAARYAIGEWQPFRRDIGDLAVSLFADDRIAEMGTTSAILGHPLNVIERIERMLPVVGYPLAAGAIILAGAATAAIAVNGTRRIQAVIADLGQVELCVNQLSTNSERQEP